MNDPAVLSAIVLGVLALIGTAITTRQNRIGARATNTLSQRVVDREEWESYTDRQDRERERLEKRIEDLEDRLEAEVTAREQAEDRAAKAEDRAVAAEDRAQRAERQVQVLSRRVTQLEEALRAHNIPVPPPAFLPADYP